MENVLFPNKDRAVKEMSYIYFADSFIFDGSDVISRPAQRIT